VEEGMASTLQHGLRFQYQAGRLIITLPSGRQMIYPEAQVLEGKLTYYGQEQTTRRWARIDTYGGKLVENIIQAIARDCLAHSMLSVNEAGFDIVMHVHDEIVCDVHSSDDALSRITSLMGQPIPWAKGLPLRADGYETYYYKKD
jgi:DNA polymerase